jgi:hypothetical protein
MLYLKEDADSYRDTGLRLRPMSVFWRKLFEILAGSLVISLGVFVISQSLETNSGICLEIHHARLLRNIELTYSTFNNRSISIDGFWS